MTGNTQIRTTGKCLPQALIWNDGEAEEHQQSEEQRQVKQEINDF